MEENPASLRVRRVAIPCVECQQTPESRSKANANAVYTVCTLTQTSVNGPCPAISTHMTISRHNNTLDIGLVKGGFANGPTITHKTNSIPGQVNNSAC